MSHKPNSSPIVPLAPEEYRHAVVVDFTAGHSVTIVGPDVASLDYALKRMTGEPAQRSQIAQVRIVPDEVIPTAPHVREEPTNRFVSRRVR